MNIIGLGVTEAGLASPETQVMKDLYDLLQTICSKVQQGTWEKPTTPNQKLCIINMDNVPNNGDRVHNHMMTLAMDNDEMKEYIATHVVCLNTMVDRITSQREGSKGLVPRCEPIPAKALVICDPHGDLPPSFEQLKEKYGVVIRKSSLEIEGDIALKLRVANGTHTAIAHVMALIQWTNTDMLSPSSQTAASEDAILTAQVLMNYLDQLVEHQIKPSSFPGFGSNCSEAQAAYDDWRPRLTHPHFGLSSFFITQNGAAKGGIRLGPTVVDLLEADQPLTVTMAYAFAVLLRWLTPRDSSTVDNGIYTGWLAGADRAATIDTTTTDAPAKVSYADGLRHNLEEGWYEFRCACTVGEERRTFSEVLAEFGSAPCQPSNYCQTIRSYLLSTEGGNLGAVAHKPALTTFVQAIATLYARIVAGDSLVEMLEEMAEASGAYAPKGMATPCGALVDKINQTDGRPLFYRPNPIPFSSQLLKAPVNAENVPSVVISEVAASMVVDLHTHLLPPSHGSLCLWGIDELLTYVSRGTVNCRGALKIVSHILCLQHYLVAEYFMTAPPAITPENFYALNKREQADIIWRALFLDRSPISEACRGVITTLVSLGLEKEVASRDLEGVRKYYSTFRDGGVAGADQFSEMVYAKAGVQYAIMTNIPFDANEASYWRPERKDYSERYRSALRVDPLLAGDRASVEKALKSSGYDVTLEGARQYLRDWCGKCTCCTV